MPRGRVKAFHPDRECGPCFLCQQTKQQHYAHPATWTDSLYSQLLKINSNIDKTSCVCRNCERDFKNGVGNVAYRPRWEAKEDAPQCIVSECSDGSQSHNIRKTSICTADEVAEIFDLRSNISGTDSIFLCNNHYRKVHRHRNSNNSMYHANKGRCKTCNSVLQGVSRKCGQASCIQAYYKELGVTLELEDSDRICGSCYNHHLKIRAASREVSLNEELEEIIQNISEMLENEAYDNCYILEALVKTLNMLGQFLLKKLAILFPDVYDAFITKAISIASDNDIVLQQVDVAKEMPKKFLLTKIVTTFGKHLICECHQLSQGLLFIRRGANLSQTLSATLSLARRQGVNLLQSHLLDTTMSEEFIPSHKHKDGPHNTSKCLEIASLELNNLLQNEAKRIIEEDEHNAYDISSFNKDEFISQINPILWDFITTITKGRVSNALTKDKKLSCIYSLCVLMFCANRQCSIPLHVLLTDIVDSCGGSKELIQILNHFGAIASTDTHKRYIQYQMKRRIEQGLTANLHKNTFTVLSIDNIDFLQSSALVYSGDQSRSWHGTTTQAVQPLVGHVPYIDNRKRKIHPTTSPLKSIVSPDSKKCKRRGRSLSESQLLNQITIRTSAKNLFPVPSNHPLQHLAENPYTALRSASLSDFQLCNTESDELYLFQKICFSYIGIKKALMTINKSEKAISLKSFLKKVRHVNCSSAVYTYLNVLDQNADNKETIADVLSLAYEEFKVGTEIQHLVVAGDAKTYSHLQTLRFEHGNKMSWLLPFIGD